MRRFAPDLSPLRDSPAYRALWLGQLVSLAGTQMRYVAVAWHVFELTGSTAAVGLIGLAEVVPLIVFSLLGGAIADAADRRRVMAYTQVGLTATSVALVALAAADTPPVGALYAVTAAASALAAVDRPARTAMIPALVAPDKLPAALALRQIGFQTTLIVGPAVAGVVISAGGVGWVYGIDVATFSVALIALRWLPPGAPAGGSAGRVDAAAIRDGLRWAFGNRLILSILVVDLVAMVLGMPRAVFPALAQRTFEMGAGGAGLLYSAPAAGALVAAVTTGWLGRVRRRGTAVIVSVAAWGAAITLAGLSLFSLPLTLVWLACAGAADVVSAILRGTMLQQETPDALRGRVSAINLMIVTGGPRLGDVEAGLVAAAIGAPGSVVLGGLGCLAGTAAVAWAFPQLRAYSAGGGRGVTGAAPK